MRTKYTLLLSALATVGFLSSGCSTHSIREGIWRLSYEAQDYETREAIPIPPKEVKVLIDWDDNKPEDEVVEMERLDPDELPQYRLIYGQIMNGQLVRFKAVTRYWHFRLEGEVRSPENISGSAGFVARHKLQEDTTFTGRWEMKWLRDE